MPFKSFIRDFTFFLAILYLLSNLSPALTVTGPFQNYVIAASILTIAHNLIKPILSILTFPMAMLSLGLFTYILSALILFGITQVFGAVNVFGFNTSDLKIPFNLPSIYIPKPLSYLVLSVIIEITRKFFKIIYQE